MNTYLISTNKGWIKTNDERMAQMPFTIDEMIEDNTVLDHPTDLDPTPYKVLFVTKNSKDYWEFGEYVGSA
jgi:hypothetical protein